MSRRRRASRRSRRRRRHAPPRRTGLRSGRDAQGDRRRDGALEARDPALLPQPHGRSRRALWPGSTAFNAAQPCRKRLLAGRAAAEGDRAGACARCRSSTDLCGRRLSPRRKASTSAGRSRCAAAAWSRRRSATPTRARCTELMAAMRDLVQRARTRRPAQLRARLRRPSPSPASASAAPRRVHRHHLSAAGRDHRLRRVSRRGRGSSTGRVEPRPLVTVSLAGDHRASDGHIGGSPAHRDRAAVAGAGRSYDRQPKPDR